MTRILQTSLIAGLLLSLALPILAESRTSEPDPLASTITIRVYDYADVPAPVAKQAQRQANRIFRKAGIETEWVSCPVPGQPLPAESKCRRKPQATDIQLNILPHKMAKKMMRHHSEFGLAYPLPDSFGSRASVFYHRVSELAENQGGSRALLLGHFIAHEIGHLLLGVNSHSDTGLMHVPWNRAQRDKAHLGTLLFTEQEADRIQLQAAARIEAAQSND